MIDIHSHILPGLDDGASTMETALAMARIAAEDGIKAMIATPHIFRDRIQETNLDLIRPAVDKFKAALQKQNIPLDIFAGAEVHISHNLFQIIGRHRQELVLNKGMYVLVEFPSTHVFAGVKDLFFDLMTESLIPIIAHPERNRVFRHNAHLLFELIEMGALVQINQGSLFGLYGESAKDAVRNFIEMRFVHFAATDCHNPTASAPQLSQAVQELITLAGEEASRALVEDNPRAVIEDKEIPYHPRPQNPKQKKKSLSIKLPFFSKKGKKA
jgi:protein-tyrosine phosphatase